MYRFFKATIQPEADKLTALIDGKRIVRIPVKQAIEVKYIPSEYVAYRSISLFGGVYKVSKPRVETSIRFMEAW